MPCQRCPRGVSNRFPPQSCFGRLWNALLEFWGLQHLGCVGQRGDKLRVRFGCRRLGVLFMRNPPVKNLGQGKSVAPGGVGNGKVPTQKGATIPNKPERCVMTRPELRKECRARIQGSCKNSSVGFVSSEAWKRRTSWSSESAAATFSSQSETRLDLWASLSYTIPTCFECLQ